MNSDHTYLAPEYTRYNNLIFQAYASLRYNNWFKDARACKLLKNDCTVVLNSFWFFEWAALGKAIMN